MSDINKALNDLNETVKRLLSEALKLRKRQQQYLGERGLKVINRDI